MKRLHYLPLLLLGGLPLQAQTSPQPLRAYILSAQDSTAVPYVLVELLQGDSVRATAMTTEKGYLELTRQGTPYALRVRLQGESFPLVAGSRGGASQVDTFYVSLPAHQLATVTVQGRQPFVRYEGGKQIYQLQQLPGLQGADLTEGLSRLPGVALHPQQGWLLHGISPLTVLVDQRPLRLTGGELEAYLRTIPLSAIAAVELIQNPSPAYGSGGRPVLHILTKQGQEAGYLGYLSLRGIHQHHWGEEALARFQLNQGIARSYVSYSFAEERSLETTSLEGGSVSQAEVLPRRTHQLSLGSDLTLSRQHRLSGHVQGAWMTEDFRLRELLQTSLRRPQLYASLAHSYQGNHLATRLALEGSWGKLSQTDLLPVHSPQSEDRTSFLRLAPSVTYTLSPTMKLWGGLSYEDTRYRYTLAGTSRDIRLSEQQWMPFLGFGGTWGKLQLEGGLRAVFDQVTLAGSSSDGQRSLSALLPTLTVSYALGKLHQLTGEIQSSYTSPDFRDLMPVASTVLRGWERYGNSGLFPSQNYTYALRYSLMQAAQLELSYSDTQSPVVEAPQLLSGAIRLRKLNLEHSRYVRALLVLPLPIVGQSRLNWLATTTAALQRQWDQGEIDGQGYRAGFTTYYIRHQHDLSYGTWSLGVGFTTYGPLRFELYEMERTWWMDARLSKRMGRWRFTASLRDPWNTNTARGSYREGGLALAFVRDWHQPRFVLGLSYQLGKTGLKGYKESRRHDATTRMRSEANEGLARGVER